MSEKPRCLDCLHFKNLAHPRKEQVCAKLGIKTYSVAPRCFSPDITQIANTSEAVVQLATLFHGYNAKQRRILMLTIESQRKTKLPLGQLVYFRALGRDYISNYLSGYVLGQTSDGQIIVGGSPDRKTAGSFYMAYFGDDSSLLRPSEWKRRKAALYEKGRISDPRQPLTKKKVDIDYEPPTLDSAPKEWVERNKVEAKRTAKTAALKKEQDGTIKLR